MTLLVTQTSLVPGRMAVRQVGGRGVRGQDIPTGGVNGPSLLYDDLDPGDDLKEFRAEVLSTTLPVEARLFVFDNGAFTIDPATPDGAYTITYRGWVDGAEYAASVVENVVIGGVSSFALNAALDLVGAGLSFTNNTPLFGLNPTLDDVIGGLNFAQAATFSIGAALNDIGSNFQLYGDSLLALPQFLSLARQYRVNPDAHLDAYSLQQGMAASWAKDPQASLDYSVEWSDWLAELDGDAISSLSVFASPGLSALSRAVRGSVTAALISGGVVGTTETLTMRIITQQGRVDERTIELVIRDR